ncbi:MAG: PQQ-binding-like beta-propeller repeat protein, partial [Planctomycetes bacterium]|nr:PQQ-binding-like beta-propeller repeat protein [Planctomycetota bacterium]
MLNSAEVKITVLSLAVFLLTFVPGIAGEEWPQLKYDCRHSGNVPDRTVEPPLGLVGAVPMTDAVFTSPVISDGRLFVVDGSGVVFCLDRETLSLKWQRATRGAAANVNNVSSPAIVDRYLHFGTMAGAYYVLDAATGAVVREIACGEPIMSAPVVSEGRVYFATLGSRVYALEPDGTAAWTWDFVAEEMGFAGDRWSGADWLAHNQGRVTWRDSFCCSMNLVAHGKLV